MFYPTCPIALAKLTDTEWDALLASVWNAPTPRVVVRLLAPPDISDDGPKRKEPVPERLRAPANRQSIALALIAQGHRKTVVAGMLGISPSLLSKILTGIRN